MNVQEYEKHVFCHDNDDEDDEEEKKKNKKPCRAQVARAQKARVRV